MLSWSAHKSLCGILDALKVAEATHQNLRASFADDLIAVAISAEKSPDNGVICSCDDASR